VSSGTLNRAQPTDQYHPVLLLILTYLSEHGHRNNAYF